MNKPYSNSRLANFCARLIGQAFKDYQRLFTLITEKAETRFETKDWVGMQADTRERLDLYKKIVDRTLGEIRELLEEKVTDELIWASTKAVYSGWIADRNDWELAETFFNSISRRIFTTVGVNPHIEFIDTDFDSPPTKAKNTVFRLYRLTGSLTALIEDIFTDFEFKIPYENLKQDAKKVASRLETELEALGGVSHIAHVEVVKPLFYRGQGAYIIGRVVCQDGQFVAVALALLSNSTGIIVNAALFHEEDLHILFSLTHAYFHVKVKRPFDLVHYLKLLMPQKRISELYTALGYNKHGKTELYRDLMHHLDTTSDQFKIADGIPGMVMLVFTMPSFDMVFKIIRDRFVPPKQTTRQAVMSQYHLVFQHDRAGRLIDAQEFEHLKFSRHLFTEELLEELKREADQTVSFEEDYLIIKHVYIERRVIPLNLYLRQASESEAKKAVIDCGNAIKDLAATNIFTGDMLLKNFGVTRHCRVVFYDYDELCWLTSCNFRILPEADNYNDEMSAEPWFSIGENDVFPEEFRRFIGLRGVLLQSFLECHTDLFGVEYWQKIQNRLHQGEIIDISPYDGSKLLVN